MSHTEANISCKDENLFKLKIKFHTILTEFMLNVMAAALT
jgi:hypothetical protein